MWQIISTYIGVVIMMIGIISFGYILLEEKSKISKIKLIIALLVASLLHTIMYLNLTPTIKTIVSTIVNIATYKYIFKKTIKKSIFLTLQYTIMILLTDLLVLLLSTNVLSIDKEFYYNVLAGSIMGNIITCIVFIVITLIVRKILRKILITKIENNLKIIIFSIMILVCSIMFFYTIINEFRFSNDVLLYLIAIAVMLVVLINSIKQTIENNKLTQKYDKLLEFMTTYENEIENQRVLRHETKNEFLTIKAKINDKQKNKEIIKYIDEILNDKIDVKQEEYAKFGYLPANGIKGLCYFKTQEAQDKKLDTSINISKRIKDSNIYNLTIKEQRDLGKILGVFLDNAIEASLKSKNKKFGIEAYLNINKKCQIIVSNSYDGELELDKIGKEKFTTKGKNRGHGLLLVNHIINNNKIFEIKTDVTKELYIQTITIK